MVIPVAILAGVAVSPANMPFTSLMVPLLLGSLLLTPRHLPWFVVYMFAALMIALALQEAPSAKTYGAVGIQVLMLPDRAGASRCAARGSGSAGPWASRCSSTCATGSCTRAASGTCRPAGRSSPRSARPAVRRSPATSSSPHQHGRPPRAGRGRRVRQGRGGRHPRAAALRRLRRPARRPAAGAVPARRQPVPPPQDWEEGFATAIHLSLDLGDGTFEVRSAGHPPAALRHAGAGRWGVLPARARSSA